jgi:DNA-binding MarR family transcriptional regulator
VTHSAPSDDQQSDGSQDGALPDALTVWISYLLRQTTLRVQERVAEALRGVGLRPPHNTVLSLLVDGPHTQIALANQLQTDRTTMVALIDDLERMQLVERRRNPRDRRAHDVTLTTQGLALLSTSRAQVSAVDDAFLAPLNTEEREELRTMLVRLIRAHDTHHERPVRHSN